MTFPSHTPDECSCSVDPKGGLLVLYYDMLEMAVFPLLLNIGKYQYKFKPLHKTLSLKELGHD